MPKRKHGPKPPASALPAVKVPTAVYPGGLSSREQAIWQAHQWQTAHAAENTPSPVNDAWSVIVDLMRQLDVTPNELAGISRKAAG